MEIEIIVKTLDWDVKNMVGVGYCPIECSFGDFSIVDKLEMDHHGAYSHLESVAVRAYRDFYGKRKDNPKFVVNHIDADCIFAIAALSGLLPHPSKDVDETLPKHVQSLWKQDLLPLAKTIAVMDTDPIGRDVTVMPFGAYLVVWNALYGCSVNSSLGACAAIQGWIHLLTAPVAVKPYLDAAVKAEKFRRNAALKDLFDRGEDVGKVLVINGSRVFGFSEWYQRVPDKGAPEDVSGWKNPVVISFAEESRHLTIGCPNKDVAEKLFGQGGLKKVFSVLNETYSLNEQSGFGGRESIGGSPRGAVMTETDLYTVASIINNCL